MKPPQPKLKDYPLPVPVTKKDIARPKYGIPDYENLASEPYASPRYTTHGGHIEFEIWYTERFGWIIPTLQIAALSARRVAAGAQERRTYAVAIKDGALVRAGFGPHVLAHHTVYVRKDRLDALKPLLELMITGQAKAGDCRERISTRRAQTAMRRRDSFGGIFGF